MEHLPVLIFALIAALIAFLPIAAWLGGGITRGFLAVLAGIALTCLVMDVQAGWLLGSPSLALGVHLDRLSLLMTAFIAVIGFVVLGYADRYLVGDPKRGRFLSATTMVVAAALVQAVSPGLVQFAAGWIAVSLGVHVLLRHEEHRIGARLAARSKFLCSRLGDAAMAAAIAILWIDHGSAAFTGSWQGSPHGLLAACLCIVAAVVCKTALVPCQHWLIGTIEAPTPLSALLHAGVVNAGGLLLARSAGWFAGAPAALDALIVVGLVSAVVGPLVMWCQSDLKRSLAWSTVGQMGFMTVQCGLGAPGAAILHLIGHGFYKANAFLRSGTYEHAIEGRPTPEPLVVAVLWWLLGLAVGGVGLALTYTVVAGDPGHLPGGWPLVAIQAVALAQVVASPTTTTAPRLARLALLVVLSAGYALLTWGAEVLLTPALAIPPATPVLAWLAPVVLAALGLFWVLLPTLASLPAVNALRVHAANGFYLPLLSERLIRGRLLSSPATALESP
ncbi:NADH dehydrogenase [Planctomycetota bacterium]|nr:NADH dehydrogenase [Planctomycetota bacterium]